MSYQQTLSLLTVMFLSQSPTALATSTSWYVNGITGNDSYACLAPASACKTIGHVLSMAKPDDSIQVAAATYLENLTIPVNLTLIGAGATTTIIDGQYKSSVISVPNSGTIVSIANVTIRNGLAVYGGGISNRGVLTIDHSIVTGNEAFSRGWAWGGGINNFGTLTVNNSAVIGNVAGCGTLGCNAGGGGINNGSGTATINNSTIQGNYIRGPAISQGGGILSRGVLIINNGTVGGNYAREGGGINGHAILQNSIVASSCYGTISAIYSISNDGSCHLSGPGNLNNTDPKLGSLGNYGGQTPTIPLLAGSAAIDAGNPSGCTDWNGKLLLTDQRGLPRPDKEDKTGCDMGAYETQVD